MLPVCVYERLFSAPSELSVCVANRLPLRRGQPYHGHFAFLPEFWSATVRLATLETTQGIKLAGVIGDADTGLQYVDLRAADPNLPNCMKALLALPDGLTRASAAQSKAKQ